MDSSKTSRSQLHRSQYPYKHNRDDIEYDPFILRSTKHPLSDCDVLMHLLKCVTGTGMLAMPFAFSSVGLLMGLIGLLINGPLIAYSIYALVDIVHTLCHRLQIPALTYPDAAELSFSTCSIQLANRMAKFIRFLVKSFIFIDLMGNCVISFVFYSNNFEQLMDSFWKIDLGIRTNICIYAVPTIFMCMINNLKLLVPLSIVANICLGINLAITSMYVTINLPAISERKFVGDLKGWPPFFGTTFYALQSTSVVLTLENEMLNPTHLIGTTSILNVTIIVAVTLYSWVGFFGYWKYGDAVLPSISLNLPVEELTSKLVKGSVGLAVFFSFPLYFYQPFQFVFDIVSKLFPPHKQMTCEILVRITLLTLITLLAYSFPYQGPMISLMGSLCVSFLSITMPMLMELCCYYDDPGYGAFKWRLIKCFVLILLSCVQLVTGTMSSLEDIRELLDNTF